MYFVSAERQPKSRASLGRDRLARSARFFGCFGALARVTRRFFGLGEVAFLALEAGFGAEFPRLGSESKRPA